jgi:hypothetical protein|tara:strand:+ start:640 stop:822 length:183 start_codon:yes stop_codon:yes gene_type:complete
MHDFLDNLGNDIWRSSDKKKRNEITPEIYEEMNKEFEEEELAFRIKVPTQEQIDEWMSRS